MFVVVFVFVYIVSFKLLSVVEIYVCSLFLAVCIRLVAFAFWLWCCFLFCIVFKSSGKLLPEFIVRHLSAFGGSLALPLWPRKALSFLVSNRFVLCVPFFALL